MLTKIWERVPSLGAKYKARFIYLRQCNRRRMDTKDGYRMLRESVRRKIRALGGSLGGIESTTVTPTAAIAATTATAAAIAAAAAHAAPTAAIKAATAATTPTASTTAVAAAAAAATSAAGVQPQQAHDENARAAGSSGMSRMPCWLPGNHQEFAKPAGTYLATATIVTARALGTFSPLVCKVMDSSSRSSSGLQKMTFVTALLDLDSATDSATVTEERLAPSGSLLCISLCHSDLLPHRP